MVFFVPTPIGNLSDISSHSLQILSDCKNIFCEDTRVSKTLLNLLRDRYKIDVNGKTFYPLHQHNYKFFLTQDNLDIFKKDCVYMSDAGMPCISDPGLFLVKFLQENGVEYEVLSGSNALLIAVASSAMVEKEFTFLGFLPNVGKDREIAIENMLKNQYPVVLYESPRRILSLIEKISKFDENREIFVIKEATKKFETKLKSCAKNLIETLKNMNLNGEWTVVVEGSKSNKFENISQDDILQLDIAPKIKAKLLSKITGRSVKKIYNEFIFK